jgi:hypothetical protein
MPAGEFDAGLRFPVPFAGEVIAGVVIVGTAAEVVTLQAAVVVPAFTVIVYAVESEAPTSPWNCKVAPTGADTVVPLVGTVTYAPELIETLTFVRVLGLPTV